jgi:clan AA aspartic protease (TIGR02281 family)
LQESYRRGCINKATYEANLRAREPLAGPQSAGLHDEIPLRFVGRIIYVPVEINGTIAIPFVLDTGATELALPADVALTLARAGALDENDVLDARPVTLADGSTQTMERVVIRRLRVGSHTAANVPATINPAASDPLLGQSFLARFGAVTIDYQRRVLILTH